MTEAAPGVKLVSADLRPHHSTPDTEVVVAAALQYLHDSTEGRWDEAAAFIADTTRFLFPGAEFDTLAAMRTGLVRRYSGLHKHIQATDVSVRDDGRVVVVASGTLSGVNLYRVPFAEVRFLDHLVVHDGLLVEQHVFNDLVTSGVLDRRA